MNNTKIWGKVLASDETIKYEFSISGLYLAFNFFIRLLLALLAFPFVYTISPEVATALMAIFLAASLFYYGFFLRAANAYALTDQRVIIHRGWLNTKAICIDYQKITDITVFSPFLENILTGSGDIHIDTAGTPGQEIVLRHIPRPYEIRKKLEEIRRPNSAT
jgi:uncharacterized membrane protein YdbT with pleckstrin-like domain